MWEPEFSNKKLWKNERSINELFRSNLDPSEVSETVLLYWKEHCLECAPPDCYNSCPLYEERTDRRCIRMKYGIYQNKSFSGLHNFGADVRFNRWAKLGTNIYPRLISVKTHNLVQRLDSFTGSVVNLIFRITDPFNPYKWFGIRPYNPQRSIFKAYAFIREWLLYLLSNKKKAFQPDSFIIEAYSFEENSYKMHVELNDKSTIYKDSFEMNPGHNFIEIPIGSILKDNSFNGSVVVYPENDLEVRTVFTWLDFIKYKKSRNAKNSPKKAQAAEKVKCVAWDLDNTIWKGILIESSPEQIVISNEIKDVIRKLDERGIIQTIVSKNNHDDAWRVLQKNGLDDYFVYPAINWAPKSSNLKKISEKININLDTIALVDDSAFERAEVSETLPQVRIYNEREINNLLSYPEFDIPVTEASKKRRLSYLTEMQREKVLEEFGEDYAGFLKSCQMKMKIFTPVEERHFMRCLELVQRSNQLNLSSKRYSETEFRELLDRKDISCFAFQCSDRFGEYGIVGFASVLLEEKSALLMDFVISCRVAQKRVEHAFIQWLGEREKKRGGKLIFAELIVTKKNGPLVKVFNELPFKIVEQTDERLLFALDLRTSKNDQDIITIEDLTESFEVKLSGQKATE
jgi:FkbH-like protein